MSHSDTSPQLVDALSQLPRRRALSTSSIRPFPIACSSSPHKETFCCNAKTAAAASVPGGRGAPPGEAASVSSPAPLIALSICPRSAPKSCCVVVPGTTAPASSPTSNLAISTMNFSFSESSAPSKIRRAASSSATACESPAPIPPRSRCSSLSIARSCSSSFVFFRYNAFSVSVCAATSCCRTRVC